MKKSQSLHLGKYIIYGIFYLLVDFLVVWVEAQRPQKQVSRALGGISILQLTLGSHDPQS